MSARAAATDACPCRAGERAPGDRLRYADCCGRFHDGAPQVHAPDAPTLMRSRYSAFVRGRSDYLLATWHPTTRPAHLDPDPPGLKWLGLEVLRHAPGDADHAQVEFVARSKLGGRAHRLHEVSRFVRENGRWLYLDGEIR